MTKQEIQAIFKEQEQFYQTRKTYSYEWRIQQLNTLEKMLKSHLPEYEKAVHQDFSKSAFDLYASEIGLLLGELKLYKRKLKKWMKSKRVRSNMVNFPSANFLRPEPLGITLVIGAWNYPFLLTLGPALAALAAGNTVVIKPSEVVPESSRAIAKSVADFFDKKVMTVVEGAVQEAQWLLELKWNKIFYTGNPKVGQIVYEAASKNLVPVTLELGGKNPMVVDKTGVHKNGLKRIVWSKFFNAGQTCVAPDYALVHEDVFDDFVEGMQQEIERQEFALENKNYTQIVNDRHQKRLENVLAPYSIDKNWIDTENRIIKPLILTDCKWDDPVMKDEIFGPILPVFSYKNKDEIWKKINRFPHPLAAYLFSRDKQMTRNFIENVKTGSIGINDAMMQLSNLNLPFGGIGNSGMGAYHGKYGFDTFSHLKPIMKKSFFLELDIKYSPRTPQKMKWIKRLMG